MERAERTRREAALDLDRQDAEVEARRRALTDASRDRQAIGKLEERQRAEHRREMARRAQIDLDEVALGVHRRRRVAAGASPPPSRASASWKLGGASGG